MIKIELTKTDKNKYYLNILQGEDEIQFSNGTILDKNELYELYIKMREIFTTGTKNEK